MWVVIKSHPPSKKFIATIHHVMILPPTLDWNAPKLTRKAEKSLDKRHNPKIPTNKRVIGGREVVAKLTNDSIFENGLLLHTPPAKFCKSHPIKIPRRRLSFVGGELVFSNIFRPGQWKSAKQRVNSGDSVWCPGIAADNMKMSKYTLLVTFS